MEGTSARSTAEPVVVMMSLLAAMQFLLAYAGIAEVLGPKNVGFALAVVGALQVAIQFWVRSQVVAVENVVAQIDTAGVAVAGPALLNVPNGEPIELQAVT